MPSPNPQTNKPAAKFPKISSLELWIIRKLLNRYKPMLEKLQSRKLWAAVIGAALTMFSQQLDLPEELTQNLVIIVVGYIAGQSLVDAAKVY